MADCGFLSNHARVLLYTARAAPEPTMAADNSTEPAVCGNPDTAEVVEEQRPPLADRDPSGHLRRPVSHEHVVAAVGVHPGRQQVDADDWNATNRPCAEIADSKPPPSACWPPEPTDTRRVSCAVRPRTNTSSSRLVSPPGSTRSTRTTGTGRARRSPEGNHR
jgi:hypothetical protein